MLEIFTASLSFASDVSKHSEQTFANEYPIKCFRFTILQKLSVDCYAFASIEEKTMQNLSWNVNYLYLFTPFIHFFFAVVTFSF